MKERKLVFMSAMWIILILATSVAANNSSLMVQSNFVAKQTTIPGGATSGPYIDKLVYSVITQDDQQVIALLDGEIDLIGKMVSPMFLDTLTEAENIEVANVLRNGHGYLTINTAKYPYNITAFRRAFAFALDKEAISDDVLDGLSVPQDSYVPQINPASIEGQLPYTYYEANPALGNILLDDAGFMDVDFDGVREAPNGEDFRVHIEVASTSNIALGVGQKAAEALTALSINATSQPTSFYDYLSRLYFHGDYDIAYLGRSFQDFDVDYLAYDFWSEYADEPYWNHPNFRNATYDSWRDQLLHATAWEGAGGVLEAAIEMQKILVYQCPMVICYENVLLSAYRTDKFEGFANDVSEGAPGWWTNYKVHLKEELGGPYGGTLHWSNPLDLDSFNFMVSTSEVTENVLQMLYDSLLRRDSEGNLISWLAESYKIETYDDNPDVPNGYTRFTFDITKTASWSDGQPLSANDVAFSLNFYLQGGNNPYGVDLNEITAAYAPNDYKVVVEFSSESYWHLSSIATKPILPYHIFKNMDPENWNLWNPDPTAEAMVTSGPFYVSDYVAGEFTELSVNDYYFKNPRIEFTEGNLGYRSTPYSVEPSITGMSEADLFLVADGGGGELTWTSRENPIPSPIDDSSQLVGDQLSINATWPDGMGIDNVSISLEKGIRFSDTKDLVIPDVSYDPYSGSIDLAQFSWMYVPGIKEGIPVDISSNFTNGDCDIMVWWADTVSSTWSFGNNLVATQMATSAHPETGSFTPNRNGTIAVGCFDYDHQAGQWTLDVSNVVNVNLGLSTGRSRFVKPVSNDGIYNLTATAKSDTTTYEIIARNVNITTHFKPTITLLHPNSGGFSESVAIMWSIDDNNIDDVHSVDVLISKDNGLTYQLFSKDLDSTSLFWSLADWTRLNSYRVKVTCSDSYGFEDYDISDASFTAGSESIVDNLNPVIIGEEYHSISIDSTGNTFEWLAFDLNPLSFEIWYQGGLINSSEWDSGFFEINCDESENGIYNYTLKVVDERENENSMTTFVIAGVASPTIDHPDDITYLVGATDNVIVWTPYDTNPATYSIECNGTEIRSDIWILGSITVSVDGLSVGAYNYTLTVTDDDELTASDTVIVKVVAELTDPTDTSTTTSFEPPELLSLIITIAAMGVIVVFVILIIRSRR
ncbi:MAG: ABC transporter substrate-binding protein [Candidatus Thorarchaeota archaeon]